MRPEIERTVPLPADRERVWRALTDPDERAAWFGGDGVLDLRPGGSGWFVLDGSVRRVLVHRVEPGRRLAFRWWDEAQPASASMVEFVLDEVPAHDAGGPFDAGGTVLTVTETAAPSTRAWLEASALASA